MVPQREGALERLDAEAAGAVDAASHVGGGDGQAPDLDVSGADVVGRQQQHLPDGGDVAQGERAQSATVVSLRIATSSTSVATVMSASALSRVSHPLRAEPQDAAPQPHPRQQSDHRHPGQFPLDLEVSPATTTRRPSPTWTPTPATPRRREEE